MNHRDRFGSAQSLVAGKVELDRMSTLVLLLALPFLVLLHTPQARPQTRIAILSDHSPRRSRIQITKCPCRSQNGPTPSSPNLSVLEPSPKGSLDLQPPYPDSTRLPRHHRLPNPPHCQNPPTHLIQSQHTTSSRSNVHRSGCQIRPSERSPRSDSSLPQSTSSPVARKRAPTRNSIDLCFIRSPRRAPE